MDVSFPRAGDGCVDISLGADWPGFNVALNDVVSSRPPRDSSETSLSTYWIDRAVEELGRMRSAGLDGFVQGGNESTLVLERGDVRARSSYGIRTGHPIPELDAQDQSVRETGSGPGTVDGDGDLT